MQQNDLYSHWRDSALTPKFFVIDARAAFAVLLVLLYPRLDTIIAAVVVITILAVLNHFKIPLIVAFRLARGFLSGPKKIIGFRR